MPFTYLIYNIGMLANDGCLAASRVYRALTYLHMYMHDYGLGSLCGIKRKKKINVVVAICGCGIIK